MFFYYFVETLKQQQMEPYERFEKVGFIKGLQKANELFDQSKAEVKAELEEHFKKIESLSGMDEHTLTIYKMGCKYVTEIIQFNYCSKLGKEQIKYLIEWPQEKPNQE